MGAMTVSQTDRVVVAIDGGNSKTDVVALHLDGSLAGRASAGTSSPHQIGTDNSIARLDELVRAASGGRRVVQANIYLAGLDLEREVAAYRTAIRTHEWTSPTTVVDNDIFALLRTGSDEADAVAVVCGAGLNAVGTRADGVSARFAALGPISGDWGGGNAIGELALWFAARGTDRRGLHTALEEAIPAALGFATVAGVTEALHLRQLPMVELGLLAPVVFELSRQGDEVARTIVDRQAEEIVRMAVSCIERLELQDVAVPVVLGGGVIRSGSEQLLAGITGWLDDLAPLAQMRVTYSRPIVGAALLALEHAGATRAALHEAQATLTF
jgi:N-acetylglucosamine kinase-like BadF-type ATPase